MFSTCTFGRIVLAAGFAVTLATVAPASSAHAGEAPRQQCTVTGMFIKCGNFPTLQQCEGARTQLGGVVEGKPLRCDGGNGNWSLRALLV